MEKYRRSNTEGKGIDDLVNAGLTDNYHLFLGLSHGYSEREMIYIINVLDNKGMDVIPDIDDWLYVAKINRMSKKQLEKLDQNKIKPGYFQHFADEQVKWIETEKYLLGQKVGHNPDDLELIKDMEETNEGERFRAFYSLKYPDHVTKNP